VGVSLENMAAHVIDPSLPKFEYEISLNPNKSKDIGNQDVWTVLHQLLDISSWSLEA
jgi:hypothetical protein